jgi:hypothetical protein
MKTQVMKKALLELSTNKEICFIKFNPDDFMVLIHKANFNNTTQDTLSYIRPRFVENKKSQAMTLAIKQTIRYITVPPERCKGVN